MTPAVAEMLLYMITAVAVLVWVEGLRFLISTVRKDKTGAEEFAKSGEPAQPNIIYGSAEVDGGAAELSQKAATLLAARSVIILDRTDESIAFETPSDWMHGQNFNMPSLHGQMRFTPLSDRTARLDYAIAKPHMRAMLILGFVFQALGFIAILAGFLLTYFFVVPSPNLNIRWQTLQMLQVAHFLWPPFLFAGSYRKSSSLIKVQFDTFIHNLPFMKV